MKPTAKSKKIEQTAELKILVDDKMPYYPRRTYAPRPMYAQRPRYAPRPKARPTSRFITRR